MTRVLAIDGLHAGYAGAAAVRDLTLHVDEGEIVALLGPNGAGKTSTLLAVSGLVEIFAGSITVLDRQAPMPRRAHRAPRWGVAHVPEDRGLHHQLTVAENLELAPAVVSSDRAYELFPALRPLARRRVGLLSGGEQQMLALARAVAAKPRLLMIDEMSLGLAPLIVRELMPILRDVARGGTGVFVVEQHADLVLEHADRAYVLSRGELVLEGPCEALRCDRHLLESSYMGAEAFDAEPRG